MSKIVSVSQLKVGDKFAFVNGQSGGAPSPLNQESKTLFVVTRLPSVNLAANTCYFRYQPADVSADDPASRESSRSFNGLPDMQVRMPGTEPEVVPPAAAPRKEPPAVVESQATFVWPEKPTKKRVVAAKSKLDAAPRAKSKPAKAAKLPPPKPGTLRLGPSSAAKLEKPTSSAPAAPKSAPEPPLSKLPTLKKVVFGKKPAGKKPATKKAAPKKSAAKKTAKRKSAKK
jgi:hypothetical protein